MQDRSGIDIMSLAEWLNTAVGWILALTFVVLLITVLVDRASMGRNLNRRTKPLTKDEDEFDER